jgi:hypothetical protein
MSSQDSREDFSAYLILISCLNNVIQVEICAANPDEAQIWQQGHHDDAAPTALRFSPRLRRLVFEDSFTAGYTTSRAMLSACYRCKQSANKDS